MPDDEWYEIAGSAHENPALELWYDKAVTAGNDVKTYRNYEITYYRPEKSRPLRKKGRNISGGKIIRETPDIK